MLDAFAAATGGLADGQARMERFNAPQAPTLDGTFTVLLARSGTTLVVEAGDSILETLLRNGIAHNYSCTQGVCGTCETAVIAGVPDHRDWVLSDAKKASNTSMMICCSGSKSPQLVLDL
jgi:vanillate O-demethylase ferredoxin subunit